MENIMRPYPINPNAFSKTVVTAFNDRIGALIQINTAEHGTSLLFGRYGRKINVPVYVSN